MHRSWPKTLYWKKRGNEAVLSLSAFLKIFLDHEDHEEAPFLSNKACWEMI